MQKNKNKQTNKQTKNLHTFVISNNFYLTAGNQTYQMFLNILDLQIIHPHTSLMSPLMVWAMSILLSAERFIDRRLEKKKTVILWLLTSTILFKLQSLATNSTQCCVKYIDILELFWSIGKRKTCSHHLEPLY